MQTRDMVMKEDMEAVAVTLAEKVFHILVLFIVLVINVHDKTFLS